jgi:hypothetical protein
MAAWVQAFPQWAIFIALLVGGIWALVTARRVRRMEAARWLHQMNQDFYKHEKFNSIRIDFDQRFSGTVGRVLQMQIFKGAEMLSEPDQHYALEIDNYLNYFENLLYLVECRHLTSRDLEAMYAYWLSLFALGENSVVRVYAATFGYERIARQAGGKEVARVSCQSELARDLEEQAQRLQLKVEKISSKSPDRSMFAFSNQLNALDVIKSLEATAHVTCRQFPGDRSEERIDVWCLDPVPSKQ